MLKRGKFPLTRVYAYVKISTLLSNCLISAPKLPFYMRKQTLIASVPTIATPSFSYMFSVLSEKSSSFKESFTRTRNGFQKPNIKLPKLAIIVIILVVVAAGVIIAFKNIPSGSQTTASSNKPSAPTPYATQVINKEFSFPIKDNDGKEISKIKYLIESANLQDEILVKGERAKAVTGRTFLIVNLKITNSYKQGIQINSRDYVRLILDGKKDELIAADIHNDPVEVQAISTKSTRIGFPINEDYKSLEIQVGEINGAKQSIKVEFPKK